MVKRIERLYRCPECNGSGRVSVPFSADTGIVGHRGAWCPVCADWKRFPRTERGTLTFQQWFAAKRTREGWPENPLPYVPDREKGPFYDTRDSLTDELVPDPKRTQAPTLWEGLYVHSGGEVISRETGEIMEEGTLEREAVKGIASFFSSARLGNTGRKNTYLTEGDKRGVLVDWCQFTLSEEGALQKACELLARPGAVAPGSTLDWAVCPGRYGYASGVRRGGVSIYWGGPATNNTVHIEITGQGCRELEFDSVITDWRLFFAKVREYEYKFTRVDIAHDVFEENTIIDDLEKAHCEGRISSRLTRGQRLTDRDMDGKPTSDGKNFGKPWQNLFVRVYNKRLERLEKGHECEHEHWCRIEIQTRNESASNMVKAFVEYGTRAFFEVLWKAIDVKCPEDKDPNKSRRETAKWWLDLLEVGRKLSISRAPKAPTLETMAKWLNHQVAAVLHTVFSVREYGMNFVNALIQAGGARLKHRHLAALIAYHEGTSNNESRSADNPLSRVVFN